LAGEGEMTAVVAEDVNEQKMHEVLKEYQRQRYQRAIEVPAEISDLTVTRNDNLEVSGFVKFAASQEEAHGAYVDYKHFFCSCMDNFVRKKLCKHIIAIVLEAYKRKEISMLEVLSLLVWRI
jgi:hypothetical protein